MKSSDERFSSESLKVSNPSDHSNASSGLPQIADSSDEEPNSPDSEEEASMDYTTKIDHGWRLSYKRSDEGVVERRRSCLERQFKHRPAPEYVKSESQQLILQQ